MLYSKKANNTRNGSIKGFSLLTMDLATAKPTKDIVKELGWEPLAHAAYSPDLAPSDYHLFASFGLALADQRFTYENVKSWPDDWLASKDR
ncbi:mariner Mos1 transposase [Trichonephila clavipes]|nr:mariner Mos1 transposase [Trichonephila clavipes]